MNGKRRGREMKILKLLGLALPVAALVLVLSTLLASGASGGSGNTKYQWDIINLDFATSTISPGGHASAFATHSGGSAHTGEITVTGVRAAARAGGGCEVGRGHG